MASSTYLLVTVPIFLVLCYSFWKRPKNLPPGPKGHFLVGNLSVLMLEGTEKAKARSNWLADYGSIMHLQVLGGHTIILNTAQAASDLMDKRSAIYSNRPRMPMLRELVGDDWMLAFVSGEPHRRRRALAQRYFQAQLKDWQYVQYDGTRSLLRNLFADPNDWVTLIRLNIVSSILRICYGYEVTRTDDSILKLLEDAMESPRNGPYLVDFFPALKYYPSWLPGGQFHKDAAEARVIRQRFRNVPFDMVRNDMAAGTAHPSFVSTLLSQLSPDEDPEHADQAGQIRDTAAILYGAAMDSMVSSMYTFIGVMAMYPDVQRRAQSELDTVLSPRLPTFDDRPSLPFIDAIVLEVLRWNVVGPLGLPHMVIEEDEYLGYRIPKGSTVLGNVWAIMRDPVAFPNPEHFDPSRFLGTTEGSATARKVMESTVFGWGRRACPGRHVALSGLFITISHILACFDICKPVDDAGNEFEPVLEFHEQSVFSRRAVPIPCTIRARRPDKMENLDMAGMIPI